ncbi:hypothetical protein [Cohnella sp. REN36]|uniref:hypothetical protein n=1 Tax=Cohnella sp. REN36 TaxID=2887347 RepID=UPI001D143ECC|nr:hypothetical protein [Cohnella sp. REN36]MCC3375043.1 hypothetical protein [Cohnella sp. REN36]
MAVKRTVLWAAGFALAAMLLAGSWLFVSKAYYPALPFEGVSKREALAKLAAGDGALVELAARPGYRWLGFRGSQQKGRERIVEEMELRGYHYTHIDGAGIFFANPNRERAIVTGTNWTSKYVLYRVPEGV